MVNRFAARFRRQLFKLHLGLAEEQTCQPGNHPITSAMSMLGRGGQEIFDEKDDDQVMVSWRNVLQIAVDLWDSTGPSF